MIKLEELGLTPEVIKRHSTVAEPAKHQSSSDRRSQRAKWVAMGLTTLGKPRRNRRHPKLAGLVGNAYHRLYMRIYRGKP